MDAEPDLRDFLLPFLDTDDPVVVRMRHEPEPASARLLVSLGAGWVVDERAPRCVRQCGYVECGRREVREFDAQEATRTVDCVVPLCTREAVAGGHRCGEHPAAKPSKRGRNNPWTREESIAALLVVAMKLGRPPTSTECVGRPDLPSAPTYSKLFGSFARWCIEAGLEPPERRPGRVLREVAAERSDEAAPAAAAPSARVMRLRVVQRIAAIRDEIDAMERELLDALEDEAA